MKIKQITSESDLRALRIGQFVADDFGKSGKIESIEVIPFKQELHYYFKLKGCTGSILIIK